MALILVIDDDPDVLEFIRLVLEIKHLVIEAAVSQGALSLVEKVVPDLIVLDILLEGSEKTGIEIRAILSAMPRLAGMPILVVSGYASGQEISDTLGIGAAAFLQKPFDGVQLKGAVDKLLASHVGVLERALIAASEADITQAIVAAAEIGRSLVIYRAIKEAIGELDEKMSSLGTWTDKPGGSE